MSPLTPTKQNNKTQSNTHKLAVMHAPPLMGKSKELTKEKKGSMNEKLLLHNITKWYSVLYKMKVLID